MSAIPLSVPTAKRGRALSARLVFEAFTWRYGLLWPLAAGAALLATVCALLLVQPMRDEQAGLLLENTAKQFELDRLVKRAKAAGPQNDGASDSLSSTLPSGGDIDVHVHAIYEAARAHGLQFTSSTLRTTDNPRTDISRVEMTLPVRATYPQLADFVESLLRDEPYLSVDQLRVRRDNVGLAEGEAEIRISCWLRLGNSALRKPTAPASRSRGTERPT